MRLANAPVFTTDQSKRNPETIEMPQHFHFDDIHRPFRDLVF
jgi:hypothetical protein